MRLTLLQRVEAFKAACPQHPASWPWVVEEDGRQVVYAVWVVGNDYRNKTTYYGAYPPRFLDRLMALFPDMAPADVLHVFSGSLPAGPYTRIDINPLLEPDIVGDVYDAPALFRDRQPFGLVIADPPYSDEDAVRYSTPMVNRLRVTQALAPVVREGGFLAWLDTVWPMHNKENWPTVGRIYLQRSTNHRVRVLSLFERTEV